MTQLRRSSAAVLLVARIVIAGRLRQRRQECHFRHVELVERLAEIIERGGGHAVGILAQEDFVQIQLENLLLRIGGIDADGEDRFLDLAREFHFAVEQEVLGHLLGDRGSALESLMLEDD
jgi:hypothetical protein